MKRLLRIYFLVNILIREEMYVLVYQSNFILTEIYVFHFHNNSLMLCYVMKHYTEKQLIIVCKILW